MSRYKELKQVVKPDSPFREVNIFKEVKNAGGAVVSPCREEWLSEGDWIYYILMWADNKERDKKRKERKEGKDRKRFGT